MTTRTYRVIATGQFSGLSPELKQRLRDEQAEHDMFESAFTAEGTFTYTPSLTRFTLRYLLEVSETSAAEADVAAGVEPRCWRRRSWPSAGSRTSRSRCRPPASRT